VAAIQRVSHVIQGSQIKENANSGRETLKSVTANICWTKIVFLGPKEPATLLGDCNKQAFHRDIWSAHDLGLDDHFTVALNDFFTGNRTSLVSAQIATVVQYELPLIHLHREKRFPLFAKRQSNGNFYWYSDTLEVSD
jgi:hypothetical protein